jgi:thiol-disulfide isomerase/thioredoxin
MHFKTMLRFFGLAGTIVLVLCSSYIKGHSQLPQGSQAPEIALNAPDGSIQKLSALQGQYVLVDFWASWCGPCRQGNKSLVKLYKKYRGKGFEILGISVDKDADAWRKAIKADKIEWVQVNDPGNWEAPVARQWRIDALPTSMLLNPQGVIELVDPEYKTLDKWLDQKLNR